MSSSGIPYSPQIKTIELLERAKSQTTELPIYRDGGLVVPTQVVYTLFKPDQSIHTNAQAGTFPGNIPQYVHAGGDLVSTMPLGEGYMQEWDITINTIVYSFRRMCAVVRRRLYPVVSDIDLFSTYKQLSDIMPSSISSYQDYIDEAWYSMIQRMRQEGSGLEYLVMSSEALRPAHINLSLYYIFRDFHSSLGQSNGRYLDLATEHHRQYKFDWKQINWIYDSGHDGFADDANDRVAKQPVIYLNRSGNFRGRRY
tara:strand:- start:5853 stop:6617 length:765 start_codon:yes stop_codon:yes gene_type:complete